MRFSFPIITENLSFSLSPSLSLFFISKCKVDGSSRVNIHDMLCIKIATPQQVLPVCERKRSVGNRKIPWLTQMHSKCVAYLSQFTGKCFQGLTSLSADHYSMQMSIMWIELLWKDNELSCNKDCIPDPLIGSCFTVIILQIFSLPCLPSLYFSPWIQSCTVFRRWKFPQFWKHGSRHSVNLS